MVVTTNYSEFANNASPWTIASEDYRGECIHPTTGKSSKSGKCSQEGFGLILYKGKPCYWLNKKKNKGCHWPKAKISDGIWFEAGIYKYKGYWNGKMIVAHIDERFITHQSYQR